MNIELVQLAGRDGDTAYNLSRTLSAIASCADDTALLVFPETHLTGFVGGQQLAQVAEPLTGPTLGAVLQAVRERGVSVVVGLAENHHGTFYNTSVLVTPEGIALQYRKTICGQVNAATLAPATVLPPCSGRACGLAC